MDRRFEVRKAEILADCKVKPAVFQDIMTRLEAFAEPFVGCLRRPEPSQSVIGAIDHPPRLCVRSKLNIPTAEFEQST